MLNKTKLNGLIFGLVALALLVYSVFRIIDSNSLDGYSETTAKVTGSRYVPTWNYGAPTGAGDANIVYIDYQFEVGGKVYTGDTYEVDLSNSYEDDLRKEVFKESEAKRILKSYPIGSNISIFYNPQSPSTSFIKSGSPSELYYFIGFSLVIGTIGVLVYTGKLKPA